MGRFADQRADVTEHVVEEEIGMLELQAPGLDFREIEDVVDDREQVLGSRVDLAQSFGLPGRRAFLAEQVGDAENGIHRRADFVAHVGQESTFCLVCRFGMGFRNVQFCRPLLDLGFQILPMAQQFLLEPLLFGVVLLDRHVVGNPAVGLAHRRDDGLLGIFAAILALVLELAGPDVALRQYLPHLLINPG